ncbi:MAG: pseudouridine-5'-phosphate glycosidase, partial [bacterium]
MLSLTSELAGALRERRPVVALESTVIAHGLPAPENLATALACEAAVREGGARPATMAIIDGRPSIGLDEAQLRELAGRKDVAKVNPANMAEVISRGGWGATTVAASLHLAERAGIRVFATGGIGGVHRGAERSFDISADLLALSRYKVVTVCAGAKAILDLPRTREVLETLGVPVIGYRTDELPAFYSRTSGLPVDRRVEAAAEVVEIARAHWELGLATGILVVVPVPVEDEIPAEELAAVIDEALAAGADLSGKAVTPFLLQRVARQTAGRSLRANMA